TNRKESHRWLVASRGPGPGKGILSGGPRSNATSHPKILNHSAPPVPKSFPLALHFFERARGKVFMFIRHVSRQRDPPDGREWAMRVSALNTSGRKTITNGGYVHVS